MINMLLISVTIEVCNVTASEIIEHWKVIVPSRTCQYIVRRVLEIVLRAQIILIYDKILIIYIIYE